MDRAYAMTEDVVSYISDWRFPRTTDRRSEERTYSDERARLKRQQQQLEYERQEFLRAKAFEKKSVSLIWNGRCWRKDGEDWLPNGSS